MQFFWWVASYFPSECGWCRRYSTTASSSTSATSATSAATTSTTSASTTAASACSQGNALDGESASTSGCGDGCGGLCLCAGHGVGCEELWGGCYLLPFVGGIFRICQFSFGGINVYPMCRFASIGS